MGSLPAALRLEAVERDAARRVRRREALDGRAVGARVAAGLAAPDVRGHRDGREAAGESRHLAREILKSSLEAREALRGPVLGAEGVPRVRALARRELREEVGHAAPARSPMQFGLPDALSRVARARALINQGL